MNFSNVADLLGFLVKIVEILEPGIAAIVQSWADGKKTAEEADVEAEGKFTAMLALLANPKADAAALNAAEDAKLDAKFPPTAGDKEEPKT